MSDRVFRNLASTPRRRVLDAIATGATSPVQASRLLSIPLTSAAHHVRELRKAGLVEVERVRLAGGSVESLYKLTELGRRVLQAARLIEEALEAEKA